MAKPLYFMHIPKCGGSSIRKKLQEKFGDELCPAWVWDDFYRRPELRERRYQAYAGHFGADLVRFLGTPLTTFVLLREPVARTVSHFFEIRRSKQYPLCGTVRGQHLLDLASNIPGYLSSPATVPLTLNFQARYLVETPISIERLSAIYPADYRNSLWAGWESVGAYVEPADLLTAATRALGSMDFVGTTERLNELFPRLAERYGLSPEPCRENVGMHHDIGLELEDRAIQRIRDLTEVDRKLFESF